MSNIIYLKDILLAKAPMKKKGRPKLKPFYQDVPVKTTLQSSLVERKKNKDKQKRGEGI
ncbi:MAG: hypothetical protein IJ730_06240 [Alphaproteobacteria bacterium]|nr:hypothetical protein [Alphaproteobacteria bacterium]